MSIISVAVAAEICSLQGKHLVGERRSHTSSDYYTYKFNLLKPRCNFEAYKYFQLGKSKLHDVALIKVLLLRAVSSAIRIDFLTWITGVVVPHIAALVNVRNADFPY